MEEFKKKGYYPAGGRSQTSSAGSITYVNTDSGLTAGNVQDAIDKVNEKINNGEIYSTDEIIIGKWIDDKPIYRKVISAVTISGDNNWNTIPDAPDNMDALVRVYGYGDVSKYIFPFVIGSNVATHYLCFSGASYKAGTGLDGGTMTVIYEYTKTTD